MDAEYWILSIVAMLVALVAGFIGGRMSAPRQRRVEAMERERDEARAEAEAVRAEVNRHFEDSARMFGKLAADYRTFFQQFSRTAQNLGLSEGRARELLQQADPSLVARQPAGPAGSDSGDSGGATPRPDASADTPGAVDGDRGSAGEPGSTTAAGTDADRVPPHADEAVPPADAPVDGGDPGHAPAGDPDAERERRD